MESFSVEGVGEVDCLFRLRRDFDMEKLHEDCPQLFQPQRTSLCC